MSFYHFPVTKRSIPVKISYLIKLSAKITRADLGLGSQAAD